MTKTVPESKAPTMQSVAQLVYQRQLREGFKSDLDDLYESANEDEIRFFEQMMSVRQNQTLQGRDGKNDLVEAAIDALGFGGIISPVPGEVSIDVGDCCVNVKIESKGGNKPKPGIPAPDSSADSGAKHPTYALTQDQLRQIKESDELRQPILKEAFAGKLTDADIEPGPLTLNLDHLEADQEGQMMIEPLAVLRDDEVAELLTPQRLRRICSGRKLDRDESLEDYYAALPTEATTLAEVSSSQEKAFLVAAQVAYRAYWEDSTPGEILIHGLISRYAKSALKPAFIDPLVSEFQADFECDLREALRVFGECPEEFTKTENA